MPVPLPPGVADSVAEVKAALAALERAVEGRARAKATATASAATSVVVGEGNTTAVAALEAAVAAVAVAEAAAGRSLSSSGIDKELSAARRALKNHKSNHR